MDRHTNTTARSPCVQYNAGSLRNQPSKPSMKFMPATKVMAGTITRLPIKTRRGGMEAIRHRCTLSWPQTGGESGKLSGAADAALHVACTRYMAKKRGYEPRIVRLGAFPGLMSNEPASRNTNVLTRHAIFPVIWGSLRKFFEAVANANPRLLFFFIGGAPRRRLLSGRLPDNGQRGNRSRRGS
jgi:hypothetical protein